MPPKARKFPIALLSSYGDLQFHEEDQPVLDEDELERVELSACQIFYSKQLRILQTSECSFQKLRFEESPKKSEA